MGITDKDGTGSISDRYCSELQLYGSSNSLQINYSENILMKL